MRVTFRRFVSDCDLSSSGQTTMADCAGSVTPLVAGAASRCSVGLQATSPAIAMTATAATPVDRTVDLIMFKVYRGTAETSVSLAGVVTVCAVVLLRDIGGVGDGYLKFDESAVWTSRE